MTVSHKAPPPSEALSRVQGSRVRGFFEWLFGILGGIATFLGFFVLFADGDQWIGIGGDLSWRVGDISSEWAYGLLVGGLVLLILALGMAFVGRPAVARGEQTVSTSLTDLLWHGGLFLVVNTFLWLQDIALGDGLNYAFWTTIPWGIGLAIHAFVVSRNRTAGIR